MHIQPITNQPKFNGKVVFEKGTTTNFVQDMRNPLWQKIKEIATIVESKPYDIFISKSKQTPDFYEVSANKTLEEAQKIKEYTVKVKSNAIVESIVDASKEAIDMYEKYIKK